MSDIHLLSWLDLAEVLGHVKRFGDISDTGKIKSLVIVIIRL